MKFKEQLRNALKNELSEDELENLPRGFQSISKVILIKIPQELYEKRKIIGMKCLAVNPKMDAVYLYRGKISGKFRTPENVEFLAGKDDPIVIHREHDVLYKFDITKIMFSKGNLKERKHLATLVQPGEVIIDMFAGIGYFSLPIGVHSEAKSIYSIELNPIAFEFLQENVELNRLGTKIVPIFGDCKEEVVKLSERGIEADRIIMGVFPAPIEYVPSALSCVKDSGTIIHYEGVIERENYKSLFDEFEKVAVSKNFSCQLKSHRFVKSYGPKLYHIVFDIIVQKTRS
jgi:tRNA wybutosine-synthesizing protein 2